jgi:F0F1-type ATP synthase assembly protein I
MALQMIVTILLGTFIGRFIDQKTNAKFPIGTLMGIFTGMGIAFYRIFKSLKSIK